MGSLPLDRAWIAAVTEFVVPAVRRLEVEPSVTIPCPLDRRDILDTRSNHFCVRDINIVDPEPRDRTGIKMVMFNRLRPEDLEQVSIVGPQPREPAHIKRALHAEDIGKEVGCLPACCCRRASPDDSLYVHNRLLTEVGDHYGNRR